APVTRTLPLGTVGLRVHALLPGGERGFAVGKLELELAQPGFGARLAGGDGLDALLETRLHARHLELGGAQIALARPGGLVARAECVLLRDRLGAALVELDALALQLTLALGDHPELG